MGAVLEFLIVEKEVENGNGKENGKGGKENGKWGGKENGK
jgi:hypothetical protein